MPERLRRLARAALGLLLPPRCLGCGALVGTDDQVCADCWSRLRFLVPPLCAHCGLPRVTADPPGGICPVCDRHPLPLDRARAAVAYDAGSRGLILGFKHAGRIEAAGLFATWMAERGQDVLADADLLVPVPLHRWRLLTRGFNQAALLAHGVARRTRIAFSPDLLVRRRATRMQQGLSAGERAANVTAAAFALHRDGPRRVAGRRIVLVDDVLTTGATLGACAAVLRHHGAASVAALTLARVVREPTDPI